MKKIKLHRKLLDKLKQKLLKKKIPNSIEKFIPPFDKNFNDSINKNYKFNYLNKYVNYILPECFKRLNYNFSAFPKILDIGCGYAPMCLAAKIFRDNSNLNKQDVQYVGIDIREDAINFNKENYRKFKNNLFVLHKSKSNRDYIGNYKKHRHKGANIHKTTAVSDGSECDYKIPIRYKANIQWSGSLFTHLTYNGVMKTLRFIYKHLEKDGISINTWHIIDPESLFSLQLGITDRKLKYDMKEFLTYSKENPLLNTAYKIKYIQKAYKKAGLKIEEIIHGSWRGNKTNQFNSAQDIIIARRK